MTLSNLLQLCSQFNLEIFLALYNDMMSYFVGSGEIPDASLQDEDIYYGRADQNSIQSSLTEWIDIKIGFFYFCYCFLNQFDLTKVIECCPLWFYCPTSRLLRQQVPNFYSAGQINGLHIKIFKIFIKNTPFIKRKCANPDLRERIRKLFRQMRFSVQKLAKAEHYQASSYRVRQLIQIF